MLSLHSRTGMDARGKEHVEMQASGRHRWNWGACNAAVMQSSLHASHLMDSHASFASPACTKPTKRFHRDALGTWLSDSDAPPVAHAGRNRVQHHGVLLLLLPCRSAVLLLLLLRCSGEAGRSVAAGAAPPE